MLDGKILVFSEKCSGIMGLNLLKKHYICLSSHYLFRLQKLCLFSFNLVCFKIRLVLFTDFSVLICARSAGMFCLPVVTHPGCVHVVSE